MTSEHDTNDPLARDVERILALRDSGRLSAAEADKLIAVLRGEAPNDVEPVTEMSDAPDAEAATPGAQSEPSVPPAPAAPPPSASGQERPGPAARPDAVGVRWLTLAVAAADLRVTPGEAGSEPRLREEVEGATLEATSDGWRLEYRVDRGSWWGIGSSPARLDVEVPSDAGVVLDVKAGDVELEGVRYVRGRMLAGDLLIDGAEEVDVDKKAGDFTARIRPTSGRHRLVAKAGDLDVTLLRGADVSVSANVKVGDLDTSGAGLEGERSSRGVGQRYSGRLGSGSAELELSLTAGSLRLRSEA